LRFLLDENFPIRLQRGLKAEGIDCEHLIGLGLRGITDAQLVQRVAEQGAVLLTHDREFKFLPIQGGKVIISRIPQGLPIEHRVDLWLRALQRFVETQPEGFRFEISEDGELQRLPGEDAS
jgi:hypothetical protein